MATEIIWPFVIRLIVMAKASEGSGATIKDSISLSDRC